MSVSVSVSSVLTVTLTQPAAAAVREPVPVVEAAPVVNPRTSLPPLPPSVPQDLTPTPGDARLALPESVTAPAAPAALVPPPSVGVPGDSAFDPLTSVVIERRQFSETWLNADGSKTTELSDQPINVQDSAGAWVEADDSVQAAAGGALTAPLHPLKPKSRPPPTATSS